MVITAMEGINVTVFAYGQTSSGKTFTMRGTELQPGLTPLAVGQVFDYIGRDQSRDYQISVSYLEVSLINSPTTILDLQWNPQWFDWHS